MNKTLIPHASLFSDSLMRAIVEALPAPMCLLDQALNILETNQAWEVLAGQPFGLFHGLGAGDSYRPVAQAGRGVDRGIRLEDVLGVFAQSETQSLSVTCRFGGKRGAESWYQVDVRRLLGEPCQGMVVSHMDITSRMMAEQALEQEQELLSAVIDHIPHGIFWKDAAGVFLGCNQSFAESVGLGTPWEVLGKVNGEVYADEEEAQRRGLEEAEVLRSGVARLDVREVREIAGRPRQFIASHLPLRDAEGLEAKGILGIFADITATSELEFQLQQARRLEAIGQLSAGIAHEINTPMQYVGDNIHFLERASTMLLDFACEMEALVATGGVDQAVCEQVGALLQKARVAALKGRLPRAIDGAKEGVAAVSKIVQAMKGFAHPGAHEKQKENLNRALETTTVVARNEWKYVAEVRLELEEAMPLVECDLSELNQVFLNLLVNAAHAVAEAHQGSGEKGLVVLGTRSLSPDWVEVRVQDNGTGIPKAHFEKLFEPFFTTKEVGKGTGQGLAISHAVVVDRHGGRLFCESTVGEGTTFVIELPVSQATLAQGGES